MHALLPLRQMSTVGSEMILHVMYFSALGNSSCVRTTGQQLAMSP